MANADQNVQGHLGGQDPDTGAWLGYQSVPVRARVTFGNFDGKQPFYTDYGQGPQPNTCATYDGVTGASEQTSGRHVDPYGNVWDFHKVWILQIYWFLDGCPSPVSQERLAQYIQLAKQLRPWPAGYQGAAKGEPTQSYPAWPPATPVSLDSFLGTGQ